MDVNADGFITPIDALIIINRLNVQGSGALDPTPNAPNTPQPFYDVNGDGDITPIDALIVINRLNTSGSGPVPHGRRWFILRDANDICGRRW